MWEEKKRKENPLPSVAVSHYMSEDSLPLTSSTADNPQITGSYFIISCRPVPRLSSPLWLGDMWRERERERAEKRVRDIGEAGGILWTGGKSVLHAWQKWCELLLRKKNIALILLSRSLIAVRKCQVMNTWVAPNERRVKHLQQYQGWPAVQKLPYTLVWVSSTDI